MMSIEHLIRQLETQSTISIPAGWGQGRATFGGLLGSLMLSRLHAVLGDLTNDRVLRSATISFIGAVAPGDVEIKTEIFRSGKSVTQASVTLLQDGAVMALLLANFGSSRVSAIDIPATISSPQGKSPEEAMKFAYILGVMPEFIQQVDLRWAQGALPFSGANKLILVDGCAGRIHFQLCPLRICWDSSILGPRLCCPCSRGRVTPVR